MREAQQNLDALVRIQTVAKELKAMVSNQRKQKRAFYKYSILVKHTVHTSISLSKAPTSLP
jgi:hypothetical protein